MGGIKDLKKYTISLPHLKNKTMGFKTLCIDGVYGRILSI
jgi:hypothetical protein